MMCANEHCDRPSDYPDGLCRECHEDKIRNGERYDALPTGKGYRKQALPLTECRKKTLYPEK